jgi:serine/threonine-protein kinase
MTAKLTHPNTVTVFDYGRTPENIFYYAMELLEGLDLERLVKASGPQDPERVRHILERIADALSEAHGVGLIHRDIKPSNIILCRQGGRLDVPKVVDFGLVQEVTGSSDLALTGEGQVLGTPLYMAPEVMRSSNAGDGRSDLYGLGAVGYYLLTGEHVFPGDNILEICFSHVHKEPIPPSERIGKPISQALEAIILSCLAKKPDDRPQHAAELRDQLIACSGLERWTEDKALRWWQSHPNVLAASFSSGEEDEEDETMARTVMFDRPTSS